MDERRDPPTPPSGQDDQPDRPQGDVRRRIGRSWLVRRRELSEGERVTTLEQLFFEGSDFVPSLYRFATLMSLSIAIATFGLLADSSAVVIGAMLIAPLMTPILAFSASTVMVWPRRQLRAALVTMAASVGGLVLAGVLSLGATRSDPTLSGEILARTEPTLLDMGVALAAGAAGAYVLVRTRAGAALPGVAIAVALVPPLATAGALLAHGESDLASGALLLFATNLVGIVLAASLVFLLTGFVPQARSLSHSREIRVGLVASGVLVLAVAYPLWNQGNEIYQDTQADGRVRDAAEAFLEQNDPETVVLSTDVNDSVDPTEVVIGLAGPSAPPSQAQVNVAAGRLSDQLGEPISLRVRYTPTVVATSSDADRSADVLGAGGR